MRSQQDAETVLKLMINTFLEYLKEIEETELNDFLYGEKTAYLECLEIIQEWTESALHGLNFELEDLYRL